MSDPGTANLGITYLQANSVQPEIAVNAGSDTIDAALAEVVTLEIDDTNAVVLSQAEFASAFTFVLAAGSPAPDASITVTLPAFARGIFRVVNDTDFDATVEVAGQGSSPPVLLPGEDAFLTSNGFEARGDRIGFQIGNSVVKAVALGDGDVVIAFIVSGSLALPAGLPGTKISVSPAAAAQADITISRIRAGVETQLGFYRILTGNTTGAFNFATDQAFEDGDVIMVRGPNPHDTAITIIYATLLAYK